MDFTFHNSSIVSVNSGTIVLNVSGKTRTFVNARLISVVYGEIVLNLPKPTIKNGSYLVIRIDTIVERIFIINPYRKCCVDYHVSQRDGHLDYKQFWTNDPFIRNATPEEIQELNDQLKAEGKCWNPDTMQIEKLRWKPKKRDKYYYIRSKGNVNSAFWRKGSVDIHRYKFGNCFQTKEEAEAKLTQIKQILNSTI